MTRCITGVLLPRDSQDFSEIARLRSIGYYDSIVEFIKCGGTTPLHRVMADMICQVRNTA